MNEMKFGKYAAQLIGLGLVGMLLCRIGGGG
jgi:hypothetical protein